MKGGQHLLRAEKQVENDDIEKVKASENSFNKSFLRLKEGLRILRCDYFFSYNSPRERQENTHYFDESGHYINYGAKKRQNKDDEIGLSLTVTETSFFPSAKESQISTKNI